jgi:hypothetical protein
MRGSSPFALPLILAACGVNAVVDEGVEPPRRLAVLPLEGTIPWRDRELIRSMLRERLRTLRLTVIENEYTDRVLSERGWMRDPERFRFDAAQLSEQCAALGVDGLVRGSAFDADELDVGVAFRDAIRGAVECHRSDGRRHWRIEHSETQSGGLALRSGQVITAVREQLEHGSSVAFVALIEDWLDTVLAVLPELPLEGFELPRAPRIEELVLATALRRGAELQRGDRIVVEVRATPGAILAFDLAPLVEGLPMVEVEPGRYRGEYRLAADAGAGNPEVRIHLRDRFGREDARAGERLSEALGARLPAPAARPGRRP